jgi:predicted Rossmann-fold nucleotide-binding protein
MSNENNNTALPEKAIPANKRKLSTSEKLIEVIGDAVAPDRHVPKSERLKILTAEQKEQLQEIEDNAIVNFGGTMDELESALGMLRIGHHMGWKVLYLIHSKKTIRKYEEILGIKIREIFDEKGPSADRSIGLALAEKFTNFWKVVSGDRDHKINAEDRKKIL